MSNVRNLNSVFGNGNYKYMNGMNVNSLTFNSLQEVNLWYVLNSMFVAKTNIDMNELTNLYESLVNKFGYTLVYHTYVDYAGNDAAASLGQQTSSTPAVTEHITNMMDAVTSELLMRNGMDYLHDSTIKSMSKEKVFNELESKSVKLTNLAGIDVEPLCETSKEVNMFFRDKGTGVEPEKFSTTFLSTLAGNKKDIEFAQGRFNIGSTGILRFCKGKFLLSRRSKVMGDSTGRYGFTYLRKAKLENPKSKRIHWEYLMLKDKDGNEFIPYLDKNTNVEYVYGKLGDSFEYGTAIKCFNLKAPSGITSNTAKLYKYIYASNLVKTYIPVVLCHIADNNAQNRNLFGRLNAMKNLKKDDKIFYTTQDTNVPVDYEDEYVKSGEVRVRFHFHGFNQDIDDSVTEYLGKDRPCLVFSLGGQAQGSLTCSQLEGYLQLTGFSRVSKYCMFTVELDDVNPYLTDEIFGSSRENMMKTDFYYALINSLCLHIVNNTSIKDMIKSFSFESSSSASTNLNEKINDYINKIDYAKYFPTLVKSGKFFAKSSGKTKSKGNNGANAGKKYSGTLVEYEDEIGVSDKSLRSIKIDLNHINSHKKVTFALPHNLSLNKDDFEGSSPRYVSYLYAGKYDDVANPSCRYKYVEEKDKKEISKYEPFANSYVSVDNNVYNEPVLRGLVRFDKSKLVVDGTYFIHLLVFDTLMNKNISSSTLNITFYKSESRENSGGDGEGKMKEINYPKLTLIAKESQCKDLISRESAMKLLNSMDYEVNADNFWETFDIALLLDGYNLTNVVVNTDSKLFTEYLHKNYKENKANKANNGLNLGIEIHKKAFSRHLKNYNDILEEEDIRKKEEDCSENQDTSKYYVESTNKLKVMLKAVENSIRVDLAEK